VSRAESRRGPSAEVRPPPPLGHSARCWTTARRHQLCPPRQRRCLAPSRELAINVDTETGRVCFPALVVRFRDALTHDESDKHHGRAYVRPASPCRVLLVYFTCDLGYII
jgi:hypothetical protein